MAFLPAVLICGKIRDEAAFAEDLKVYEAWLAQGQISDLVFSGWVEDRNHPLLERIKDVGGRVVLSEPPVLRGSGHVFHQIKSLHYGLQEFSPDQLVIRARTDKMWLHFEPSKVAQRFWLLPPPQDGSPFSRRLIVLAAAPFQPFFYNDMLFIGQRSDLDRLLSFDLWFELEHALLNPEQIIHFTPFRDTAPATRHFFRVNPGLEHFDRQRSRDAYRLLFGHELYLRALAESLSALLAHYAMGLKDPDPFNGLTAPSLVDLFDCSDTRTFDLWFHEGANNLSLNHPDAIDYILDLPVSLEDRRTLRQIADLPALSVAEMDAKAADLADNFMRRFPDWDHSLAFPYRDGRELIVPSRRPNVWL